MRRLLIIAAAALALAAPAASRAQSFTATGSILQATGPDVWVRFLGSDAGYTSDLWFCAAVGSCGTFLFRNHASTPGSEIDLGGTFSPGQEILFGLNVTDTGNWFYTGPASRNPDNYAHFATLGVNDVTANATYTVEGGFEDTFGGGDGDHNDLLFEFGGVAARESTTTPEPASLALIATGLVGLGGAARSRRTVRPG